MIPHCDFDLHFSDNEHLFVCLLATCMSSLEKCLFSFLVHFFIGFFIFLALSCMSCLYVLEINSLSVVSFAVIFSHSGGFLFSLLIVSFIAQKLGRGFLFCDDRECDCHGVNCVPFTPIKKKKKELKEQSLDAEILCLDSVKKSSFIFARKILRLFHKLESTLFIIYITNTHEH